MKNKKTQTQKTKGARKREREWVSARENVRYISSEYNKTREGEKEKVWDEHVVCRVVCIIYNAYFKKNHLPITRHRLQRHTVTVNCTLRVHALNVTHFLHFVWGACTEQFLELLTSMVWYIQSERIKFLIIIIPYFWSINDLFWGFTRIIFFSFPVLISIARPVITKSQRVNPQIIIMIICSSFSSAN